MNRVGKWFPVESVSFPRSGHKLTTDWLTNYFGSEFIYDGEWRSSEWKPGVHFQKNHDFDLNVLFLEDRKYLVQVRDPFDSLLSWHQMTVRSDGIPNDKETFRRIAREKMAYLSGFLGKWVFSDNVPNRMIVTYRDLVGRPADSLRRLVNFFGESPDEERIQETIRRIPPNPKVEYFFL